MNSKSRDSVPLRLLSYALTFVLVIGVLSILYSTLVMLILPTPNEYEGSFPSKEAPFLSEEFWTRLINGILRHLALLNEHIRPYSIIGIVGLAFATLLIYTIREKVLEIIETQKKGNKGEIRLEEYIKWGFGSIISAIISTASVVFGEIQKANIILLLSVSAFILYVMYPESRIMSAIKNWVSIKVLKKKQGENT